MIDKGINMDGKGQILTQLSQVYHAWEELLASLLKEQIIEPALPDEWSIKDKIAHLWSWQQVSVARMEAALTDKEPVYPAWWELFGPDPEENVDRTNSWLFDASREKSWSKVYAEWKAQFQHYLEVTSQVAEEDLLGLG